MVFAVAGVYQIVVVDDGKIAEQGTHDELLQQKGIYHRLVSKQVCLFDSG